MAKRRYPPRKLERLNNTEGRGVSGLAASGAVVAADVCHKILSTEPERAPLKAFVQPICCSLDFGLAEFY